MVFRNGFGVKESGRLRKEKRRLVQKERAARKETEKKGEEINASVREV